MFILQCGCGVEGSLRLKYSKHGLTWVDLKIMLHYLFVFIIKCYKYNYFDELKCVSIIKYMHLNIGQTKVAGKWLFNPPKE